MKLEIKHLAPYLPYGLKIEHTYFGILEPEKSIDAISAISSEWISFIKSCDYYFDDLEPECNIKPILRPLSDLTKEIEVNGEKFVPIVEMLSICYSNIFRYYPNLSYTELVNDKSSLSAGFIAHESESNDRLGFTYDNDSMNHSFRFTINGSDMNINQLQLFEKLFEWHFDVYNFIENGLAININTLQQ